MRKQKERFPLIKHAEFLHDETRASCSIEFTAYEILHSPRKNEVFVICEFIYSFACNCYYICSFFSSEDALRRAFMSGVRRYTDSILTSAPQKKAGKRTPGTLNDVIKEVAASFGPKPTFSSEAGHTHTFILENFETPWFMAKKGQRFSGNVVIPQPSDRLKIKMKLPQPA